MYGKTTLVGVDWRARLIGKGLTLGLLVILLSILYSALVTLFGSRVDAPVTPLGHLLAAVTVAVLVVPLRNRLGVAVNRMLHHDWQTSQALLRDVGAALSHTISLDGLHTILIADLPARLRLQSATLWMLEPPDDRSFVALGSAGTRQETPLLVNGAIARRLQSVPAYLLIPSTDPDLDWSPLLEQNVRLVLPLRIRERLIGWYGCGLPQRGQLYPERVLNALLMLAPALASALENARAYTTIEQLNRELRELDQLKAEFIQSVGHELRTPLTTLSLAIQLYDRQASMTPALANITRTGIEQLQALVDRVLAFDLGMPPPAEGAELQLLTIRLAPLLQEIAAAYVPIATAKGVRFDLRVPPDYTARAHIPSLCRALHEIVDNAVRYSEGGTVTIAALMHDGHALLSITDEGPGIPHDERDRLFEAFYRGSGTRALAATPGTGLGLSIARRDIEAIGGQIWLEESGPEGSTMCIAIPADAPAAPATHEPMRERALGA